MLLKTIRTLWCDAVRPTDDLNEHKLRCVRPETLPSEYQVLPNSVDFMIPGFRQHYREGDRVLAPGQRDCAEWYNDFVTRLSTAAGREFLPVCRLSDGEFLFMFGEQPPDLRLPLRLRLFGRLRQGVRMIVRGGGFHAATAPGVSSGRFTAAEWKSARARYNKLLRYVAERGVLALHLSYAPRNYFQERYFAALKTWLSDQNIVLDYINYVPFYFVYAALTGPRRAELLRGRRLLLVHSAQGSKRDRIIRHLQQEGAAEVKWLGISSEQSFYDQLDVTHLIGTSDLVLVGAGVGKPNILAQLAPLNVPTIDAGFLFEVWADPERKWDRACCVPDEEWDDARVRFVPPEREYSRMTE